MRCLLLKNYKVNGESNMNKKKFSLAILALSTLVLTACGGNDSDGAAAAKENIIVGTSPGPYSELFIDDIVPILEDKGYTVEAVEFSDLRSADVALQEGAVDVNVDQHTAYMDNFNTEADASLVAITPIPTVPTGMYSEKRASIEEVQDGDQVGIPDDASNAARALLLLEKAGWITLDESVEAMQTTTSNIVENPHQLEIVEMSSAQIPRSLDDLDYGIIPGSMLYAAGMSSNDSLLNEDILPHLILHAVVDEQNAETEWANAIVEAYRSDEFLERMEEVNTDNYWFIPEELTN